MAVWATIYMTAVITEEVSNNADVEGVCVCVCFKFIGQWI